jgi:hypothetical protein
MTNRHRQRCPKWTTPRVGQQFAAHLQHQVTQNLSDVLGLDLGRLIDHYDQDNVSLSPTSMLCTDENKSFEALASLRLVTELTRKYADNSSSDDRRQAAIEGFLASEAACSYYNTKGWKRLGDQSPLVDLARRFIRRVIGGVLPSQEELVRRARHGPGASVGVQGRASGAYFKYTQWPYTVTADALDQARDLIRCDDRWLGALEDSYRRRCNIPMWVILDWDLFWRNVFKIVPGNRVTTVPKDSSKDRTIAVEPTMNMMLQLGVDGFIRHRLKRFGVDLDDQSHNILMAHRGSVDNNLSTLDLAAASDTVSLRTCKLLLPDDWFKHLCTLRSPRGVLPNGQILRYSKISSMGNGYTFALESLIFSSILYASMRLTRIPWQRKNVAVFGDDLIVPREAEMRSVAALELFGFTTNLSKSFGEGPFRESCGADWYRGRMMRAVYLKKPVGSVMDLYRLHNALLRWSIVTLNCETALADTLDFIVNRIPIHLRVYGPVDDDSLANYLMDPSWQPSYDKDGSLLPFKSVIQTSRKVKVREWFFGRLLVSHHPSRHRVGARPIPPFRWRGQVYLRTATTLLDPKGSGGSSYEATLRTQGTLRLVNGYRLTPGRFGRQPTDIAQCVVRRFSRLLHQS